MEDLRIGRRTSSRTGFQAINTTAAEIVQASPYRVALIITAPQAVRVTLGNNSQIVLDNGITIVSSGGPLYLDLATHGDVVRLPWYGISTSAGVVGYIEVLLAEE
jgi:hypothetical protein